MQIILKNTQFISKIGLKIKFQKINIKYPKKLIKHLKFIN